MYLLFFFFPPSSSCPYFNTLRVDFPTPGTAASSSELVTFLFCIFREFSVCAEGKSSILQILLILVVRWIHGDLLESALELPFLQVLFRWWSSCRHKAQQTLGSWLLRLGASAPSMWRSQEVTVQSRLHTCLSNHVFLLWCKPSAGKHKEMLILKNLCLKDSCFL